MNTENNGFDYDLMVEDAMRGLVRRVLDRAAAEGLYGDHHFYISFRTDAPGVGMPARLKAQYPQEITVVVQHQYWNLEVGEDGFSVELAFGGKRERLDVPFAALTGFADPSAKFGLKFGAEQWAPEAAGSGMDSAAPAPQPEAAAAPAQKVVSLDQFRKK